MIGRNTSRRSDEFNGAREGDDQLDSIRVGRLAIKIHRSLQFYFYYLESAGKAVDSHRE